MPGETALTRSGASSTANGRIIASNAPLIAASPAVAGIAERADPAVTSVTDPSGRSVGSAACSVET